MGFTEEQVDKVIQHAHDTFKQLLQEDFDHYESKNGVSVHLKKQGSNPYIVKGHAVLDHTAQEILDLINPKQSYEVAATFIPKISQRNHIERFKKR